MQTVITLRAFCIGFRAREFMVWAANHKRAAKVSLQEHVASRLNQPDLFETVAHVIPLE